MKKFTFSSLLTAVVLFCMFLVCHARNMTSVTSPCTLIALEEIQAAFPAILSMENTSYGLHNTCSYLDKFGIPALTVTVGRDTASSFSAMMENLGDGYLVKNVSGLGDEAAMAVSRGKPEYGIEGGNVAELYVRKGTSFLLFAPMRLKVRAVGQDLGTLKMISGKIADQLPE